MGSNLYYYFVEDKRSPDAALDGLRNREFQAGRYNPVLPRVAFDPERLLAQAPGQGHRSIADAIAAAAEDGTRSILDVASVGTQPAYGVAAPFDVWQLRATCTSDRPTRANISASMGRLCQDIPRGMARYTAVYDEGGSHAGYFFAGYSYD